MDRKIETTWWLSRKAVDSGYTDWPDDYEPELGQQEAFWVRVAAHNASDHTIDLVTYNLVAPMDMVVLRWYQQQGVYEMPLTGAENKRVGIPPEHQVQFFAAERKMPKGFIWVSHYLMIVGDWAGRTSLLHEITDGASSMRHIQVVR
jgi:hypothetical protein